MVRLVFAEGKPGLILNDRKFEISFCFDFAARFLSQLPASSLPGLSMLVSITTPNHVRHLLGAAWYLPGVSTVEQFVGGFFKFAMAQIAQSLLELHEAVDAHVEHKIDQCLLHRAGHVFPADDVALAFGYGSERSSSKMNWMAASLSPLSWML